MCREPDFNVIDGLSHPKDKAVSLLRNARIVADPAGRVQLLAPLPACDMLAEQASYRIMVDCQVLCVGLCLALMLSAKSLTGKARVATSAVGRLTCPFICGRGSLSSPSETSAQEANMPSNILSW